MLLVVGTSIGLYFLRSRKSKKGLSYAVHANSPLVPEIDDDLELTYRGREARSSRLVLVEILNSGNAPIREEDFTQGLQVYLVEYAEVLLAEITECEPSTLRPVLAPSHTGVTIEPLLLNVRDSFTVKVILAHPVDQISVDGRIAGVKNIRDAGKKVSEIDGDTIVI